MLFYALFPLFYFRCDTWVRRLALLFFLLFLYSCAQVLAGYAFDDAARARYLTFSIVRHLPVFVIGMLIFDLFVHLRTEHADAGTADRQRAIGLACIGGFLVLFTASIGGRLQTMVVDVYYWVAMAYGLLLIGLWLAPLRLVVNRTTAYLGKIGYSVYLAHPVVILLLLPAYPWIYALRIGTSLKFLIATAMTVTAVLCVATLTFRLIEAPGMRLGQRVFDRIQRRPTGMDDAMADVVATK